MPEHRIRLRNAWERLDSDAHEPRRVDLPITWLAEELVGTFTLRRGCGGPPVTSASERHYLELAEAPGVTAVRLNGQTIARPETRSIRVLVSHTLQPRNLVEIDVQGSAVGPIEPGRPWGEVALVIVGD